MGRRASPWSYRAGDWGHQSVTVFEREPGGVLYVRTKGKNGRYAPLSLRHRDKERAKAYALEQAARLAQGVEDIRLGKLTLARLFTLYTTHQVPQHTPREQSEDRRRVLLWTRVLGGQKDVSRITRGEMERFCDLRASGALSARGEVVPEAKRQPVRVRAVERDVLWLRWCCNWACSWQDEEARFLLAVNPLRGFRPPSEANPRRPIASTDRLEKVLAAADNLEMEVRWGGESVRQRCHLSRPTHAGCGDGPSDLSGKDAAVAGCCLGPRTTRRDPVACR